MTIEEQSSLTASVPATTPPPPLYNDPEGDDALGDGDGDGDAAEIRALLPMLRRIREERMAGIGGNEGECGGCDGGSVTSWEEDSSSAAARSSSPQGCQAIGHNNGPVLARSSILGRLTGGYEDGRGEVGEGPATTTNNGSGSGARTSSALSKKSANGNNEMTLPHDMYSVIFVADARTPSFYFALFVFLFQIGILTLIMLDIIDLSSSGNALGIPAGASSSVRAAQIMALLVVVITQDDVISSINILHYGYHLPSGNRETGGGLKWQWFLSIALRFAEGALCLVATFIIIMQASEVLGLFVDFLAMTFVSDIDDIVYALSREGFFGGGAKQSSLAVNRVRVPTSSRLFHRYFRPVAFFVITAALIAGWVVIIAKQNAGDYLTCQSIFVQMSDDFLTSASWFSGLYAVQPSVNLAGRVEYVARPNPYAADDILYGTAKFSYCNTENAWTFSFSDPGEAFDPCLWYAKSVPTDSHDIMLVANDQWYVLDPESSEPVPFQNFVLRCDDCSNDAAGRACSSYGECLNNHCVCDDLRFGTRCQFDYPCQSIELDETRAPFSGDWGTSYDALLRDGEQVEVYNRPAYVSEQQTGSFDVIVFVGRRWVLFSTESVEAIDSVTNATFLDARLKPMTLKALTNYLLTFHGYWYRNTVTFSFASNPNDVETPTDAVSPVGLDWFRAYSHSNGVDQTRPVEALFLCSVCETENNPCKNKGLCVNGTCDCVAGTFGPLCQVAQSEVCRTIKAQFGDMTVPSLGLFSGPYSQWVDEPKIPSPVNLCSFERFSDSRAFYVQDQYFSAAFAYCKNETFWSLFRWDPNETESVSCIDPCTDWTARSIQTSTYDVTDKDLYWFVRRNLATTSFVTFDYFSLWCGDCSEGYCETWGTCEDNHCVCDSDDRFGGLCQFNEPCRSIEVDVSTPAFPNQWPASFGILQDANGTGVEMYERPVYYNFDNASWNHTFYIIMFVGRRWMAATSEDMAVPLTSNITSSDALAEFIRNINPFEQIMGFQFLSDPVDVGTEEDVATPINLGWFERELYTSAADYDRPLETLLICSYCNEADYPCYHGGKCVNGTCLCNEGTNGTLCQVVDY